ncbi:hypothetical protein C1752_07876 [Acaryochloris thomasi RCC1774]|uniref:Uncharacterized protein n=1 Tax=Acaryochloris thomasi RCC1774 TaxID=1764569 RepID=A0A2W1JB00_9CYAN|nr:hypothetical protein [Acaryochloris thomasi]PZD71148.1 hypothetical protein C1752_07876 [Acaryochloris thomasi RCC1774]
MIPTYKQPLTKEFEDLRQATNHLVDQLARRDEACESTTPTSQSRWIPAIEHTEKDPELLYKLIKKSGYFCTLRRRQRHIFPQA